MLILNNTTNAKRTKMRKEIFATKLSELKKLVKPEELLLVENEVDEVLIYILINKLYNNKI
jgi:hypothetical protein